MSKEEYDQLTNNAEVTAQLQKVEANKTKYETIKAQFLTRKAVTLAGADYGKKGKATLEMSTQKDEDTLSNK